MLAMENRFLIAWSYVQAVGRLLMETEIERKRKEERMNGRKWIVVTRKRMKLKFLESPTFNIFYDEVACGAWASERLVLERVAILWPGGVFKINQNKIISGFFINPSSWNVSEKENKGKIHMAIPSAIETLIKPQPTLPAVGKGIAQYVKITRIRLRISILSQ